MLDTGATSPVSTNPFPWFPSENLPKRDAFRNLIDRLKRVQARSQSFGASRPNNVGESVLDSWAARVRRAPTARQMKKLKIKNLAQMAHEVRSLCKESFSYYCSKVRESIPGVFRSCSEFSSTLVGKYGLPRLGSVSVEPMQEEDAFTVALNSVLKDVSRYRFVMANVSKMEQEALCPGNRGFCPQLECSGAYTFYCHMEDLMDATSNLITNLKDDMATLQIPVEQQRNTVTLDSYSLSPVTTTPRQEYTLASLHQYSKLSSEMQEMFVYLYNLV
ncbi:uncharacterized protein LOC106150477 isoform X2 [Lingula anatina]|nr:uncharacterized protein LOC106150477 isoform X2 [Lingula anatina]|eukprot:XP_013378785.1 uncharacterized protein LOC106150477 isoform X2 [Lingula anatina]